ncbi:probable cytochrome P450 4aa1 [Schistocerca nitens]|uniref:probable cytochrome P450 4aa1 n=1 Tax=Schistocerca nitens TaxID=7011 RepID=UPI0021188906|nr:probable cytochrome P450 4aa1 [Schistocerca nitens]
MPVPLAVCAALASLCSGVLVLAAWLWMTRPRTSIPGPPTLPLLGNATLFYKLPVLLDRLGDLKHRYGDIFRFYVGPKLVIVITEPEDVQRLLVTSKPRERDPYLGFMLSTIQGNGLLVNKGEVWKLHRKFVEPGFHNEELEKFMDTFNAEASFLCEKLAESNGTEIDLTVWLILTTLRTIHATVFSFKLENMEPDLKKQEELAAEIVDFTRAFSRMLYRPWTAISFFKWMTEDGRKLVRINAFTRSFAQKSISLVRRNLSNKNISARSLLTCLLPGNKLGVTATEKEILDEAITLSSTGTETTADTMGYMMTLLGLHPEWQERAQRELDDVFGTGGDYLRPVTTADFAQLPVLDAIVKETLRLFPTAPAAPYVVTEDIPLAGGRYVAPRGSTAMVAYYLLHRQPQLFPDPHKFDPSRFLEGGSATNRKPYSYVPFGVGPRKCVGGRYATLQIKTVLSTVLRRYHILPGSSRKDLEESVFSIALFPLTGYRVTFVPRDNIPSSSP